MTDSNGRDTAMIILHEIYGVNPHIRLVSDGFTTAGYEVFCPDLLNGGGPFGYDQEETAYRYFTEDIGFDSAVGQVKELVGRVRGRYRRVFVCGFSVGATIGWRLCSEIDGCDGAVGFYGSRIRDYLDRQPRCPVMLVFPERELSFAVEGLARELESKENVEVRVLAGRHGFCDPFSVNYDRRSHCDAMRMVEGFLSRLG